MLTYALNTVSVFHLLLKDDRVHSTYPRGGQDRFMPAAVTRDRRREYLTLSQDNGMRWLECQRPVVRP